MAKRDRPLTELVSKSLEAALARQRTREILSQDSAIVPSSVVIERFAREVVIPNWSRILDITADNTLCVALLEPKNEWVTTGLPKMGWNGRSPVFSVNRSLAERMAARMSAVTDPVTAAWLRRRVRGQRRIFAVMHLGTLLLNLTLSPDGPTLEPEPGSLG
ncbi:MAG TPA: hypothetical protein VGG39_23590 [Polyangiaceae bacterium]|jgi:hypothetical protein